MKYKRWKREARKFWVEHFGMAVDAPFVEVAAKIVSEYKRIQYDGHGSPPNRETAADFVAFAADVATSRPNRLNKELQKCVTTIS